MTNFIGYYTNYIPGTEGILHSLQTRFGGQLQEMSYEQKIVFRAALAHYVSNNPVWLGVGSSISLIDCCIEAAGVDWNIWDSDPELVECIQACQELHESDIEGLIEALTAQIRGRIYSSRIEEQGVVSP